MLPTEFSPDQRGELLNTAQKVELIGQYLTPGYAYGVAVSGGYAYVADWDRGLRVIAVSDPVRPVERGYYDTPGYAWGVAVSGGYAYVADEGGGLRVIKVSDPWHPVERGFYDPLAHVYDVVVSGDYIYVTDGGGALTILRFTGVPTERMYLPLIIRSQVQGPADVASDTDRGVGQDADA